MRLVTVAPLLVAALLCGAAPAAATGGQQTGCAIDLTKDVAEKEPIVLQRKCASKTCEWKLPEGDEDHLFFQNGEEILVACPDKNNKLQNFPSQPKSIVAVCNGKNGANFKVDSKEYTAQDFACERTSKGEIKNMNTMCGPRNAELLDLGFTVREQWYQLIKVCHVRSRSETLYTEHVLQGEAEKKKRPAKRPTFEEAGYYQGFSANDAYKNVNKTLREVTGLSKFPSSVPANIDRGHLAPDGDFPLTPYRYSTYFYVNTAPMWSVINRGNWVALEEKIRKLAKSAQVDLHIATGVFQVMELKDSNRDLKELFLHTTPTRKQIPVPKFLWKVVYDEKSKKGIAFVVLNDPFKKTVDSSDELCPNICKESGWHDKWKSISKGYLYCCEVNQLKKSVSYIPKYDVKSILTGRN